MAIRGKVISIKENEKGNAAEVIIVVGGPERYDLGLGTVDIEYQDDAD